MGSNRDLVGTRVRITYAPNRGPRGIFEGVVWAMNDEGFVLRKVVIFPPRGTGGSVEVDEYLFWRADVKVEEIDRI